jgi:hypothetical protein
VLTLSMVRSRYTGGEAALSVRRYVVVRVSRSLLSKTRPSCVVVLVASTSRFGPPAFELALST